MPGAPVLSLDIEAAARAAEDDAGMQRIAGCHAAFAARPDRLPVALPDLRELAARSHGHGAAVLLRARDPVWESIVDRDVINLRDGLIQPRAPLHLGNVVFARVGRDDRPLIAREDDDVGVVRRHPYPLVIVATGRAAERHPRFAAVLRSGR